MCHDEPREPAKRKSEPGNSGGENDVKPKSETVTDGSLNPLHPNRSDTGLNFPHTQVTSNAPLVQPTPIPTPSQTGFAGSNCKSKVSNVLQRTRVDRFRKVPSVSDWNFGSQSHLLQDMHTLHPQFMFNTSEVSNEYNLLNDFLSNSLLEDSAPFSNDDVNGMFSESIAFNSNATHNISESMLPPGQQVTATAVPPQAIMGGTISRPASGFPIDKAREQYYMTAADPAGSESPEERLKKLLKAKYDAGLLKPFNYVKGYARLNHYMERNLQPLSRMKILRQLDKFRPLFRERVKSLTDMQLTYVEMHFERSLMEYDRVFASMPIPACCWRRTGEIYRGNKEMAELIHVPIEKLKDVSSPCF